MNKKTKITGGIIGAGISVAVVVSSLSGGILKEDPQILNEDLGVIEEVVDCQPSEITLDLKHKRWQIGGVHLRKVVERACVSPADYETIKTALKNEYLTEKYDNGEPYDIEHSNRDLIYAVLNNEILNDTSSTNGLDDRALVEKYIVNP
jgi:hypothetical protein